MALDYASLPDDLEELKQQLLKHAAWVESLKAEVLRLKRWRYGRSAEAIDLSIAPELPLGEGAVAPVTSASATEAPPLPRLVSVDEPQPRRLGRRAPRTLPADLPRVVQPGTRLLLDDGALSLVVESTTHTDVICRVVDGGHDRVRESYEA